MRGEERDVNSPDAATPYLEIETYETTTRKRGQIMTTQSMRTGDNQTIHDILVASSFGLWAVVLGFMPVLAIYGLSGG